MPHKFKLEAANGSGWQMCYEVGCYPHTCNPTKRTCQNPLIVIFPPYNFLEKSILILQNQVDFPIHQDAFECDGLNKVGGEP